MYLNGSPPNKRSGGSFKKKSSKLLKSSVLRNLNATKGNSTTPTPTIITTPAAVAPTATRIPRPTTEETITTKPKPSSSSSSSSLSSGSGCSSSTIIYSSPMASSTSTLYSTSSAASLIGSNSITSTGGGNGIGGGGAGGSIHHSSSHHVGGSSRTKRNKRSTWGARERAGMSFLIVIAFFAVFGLIILTELFMIDDKNHGGVVILRHSNLAGRLGDSMPDYDNVKEDYDLLDGSLLLGDNKLGIFQFRSDNKLKMTGELLNTYLIPNFHFLDTQKEKKFQKLKSKNNNNERKWILHNFTDRLSVGIPVAPDFGNGANFVGRIDNGAGGGVGGGGGGGGGTKGGLGGSNGGGSMGGSLGGSLSGSNIAAGLANSPSIPWGHLLPTKIEQTLPHYSIGNQPTDGSWQVVNGTRFKFFVFSAYYDRRDGKMVRIIGATKTRGPERVWCRFWYPYKDSNNKIKYYSATVMSRVKVNKHKYGGHVTAVVKIVI